MFEYLLFDYEREGLKTPEEQGEFLFEILSQQAQEHTVAIIYSANNEQAENLYQFYNTKGGANNFENIISGNNQAAAFKVLSKRIAQNNFLNKIYILPIATIQKGGKSGKSKPSHLKNIIRDLCNIQQHLECGRHVYVLTNHNHLREKKGKKYQIGDGGARYFYREDKKAISFEGKSLSCGDFVEKVIDYFGKIYKENQVDKKAELAKILNPYYMMLLDEEDNIRYGLTITRPNLRISVISALQKQHHLKNDNYKLCLIDHEAKIPEKRSDYTIYIFKRDKIKNELMISSSKKSLSQSALFSAKKKARKTLKIENNTEIENNTKIFALTSNSNEPIKLHLTEDELISLNFPTENEPDKILLYAEFPGLIDKIAQKCGHITERIKDVFFSPSYNLRIEFHHQEKYKEDVELLSRNLAIYGARILKEIIDEHSINKDQNFKQKGKTSYIVSIEEEQAFWFLKNYCNISLQNIAYFIAKHIAINPINKLVKEKALVQKKVISKIAKEKRTEKSVVITPYHILFNDKIFNLEEAKKDKLFGIPHAGINEKGMRHPEAVVNILPNLMKGLSGLDITEPYYHFHLLSMQFPLLEAMPSLNQGLQKIRANRTEEAKCSLHELVWAIYNSLTYGAAILYQKFKLQGFFEEKSNIRRQIDEYHGSIPKKITDYFFADDKENSSLMCLLRCWVMVQIAFIANLKGNVYLLSAILLGLNNSAELLKVFTVASKDFKDIFDFIQSQILVEDVFQEASMVTKVVGYNAKFGPTLPLLENFSKQHEIEENKSKISLLKPILDSIHAVPLPSFKFELNTFLNFNKATGKKLENLYLPVSEKKKFIDNLCQISLWVDMVQCAQAVADKLNTPLCLGFRIVAEKISWDTEHFINLLKNNGTAFGKGTFVEILKNKDISIELIDAILKYNLMGADYFKIEEINNALNSRLNKEIIYGFLGKHLIFLPELNSSSPLPEEDVFSKNILQQSSTNSALSLKEESSGEIQEETSEESNEQDSMKTKRLSSKLLSSSMESILIPGSLPHEKSDFHLTLLKEAMFYGDDLIRCVQKTSNTINESNDSNKKLQFHAESYGYFCKNVEANGNCFYLAVADQLNLHLDLRLNFDIGKMGSCLRKLACEYIEENSEFYEGFIDETFDLNKQAKNHIWVEDLVITALCHALNLNLIIVRSDGGEPTIKRFPEAACTIVLGYQVGLHYQSLHSKDIELNKKLLDKDKDAITDVKKFPVSDTIKTEEELKNKLLNLMSSGKTQQDINVELYNELLKYTIILGEKENIEAAIQTSLIEKENPTSQMNSLHLKSHGIFAPIAGPEKILSNQPVKAKITPSQLAKAVLQGISNKMRGIFNEEDKKTILMKLEKELSKERYTALLETGNIRELAKKIVDSSTDELFGINLDEKKLSSEMIRTGMGLM